VDRAPSVETGSPAATRSGDSGQALPLRMAVTG